MKSSTVLGVVCSAFCLFAFSSAFAQDPVSYLNDTGSPAYSVTIPVENGYIDVSNGNLHLEFSLGSPAQRGALRLNERLAYDSRIWMFSPFGTHGSYHWWPNNVPGAASSSGGWRFLTGGETGAVTYTYVGSQPSEFCYDGSQNTSTQYSLSWTDPNGTAHPTSGMLTEESGSCALPNTLSAGAATDGSGYFLQDDGAGNPIVIDRDGTQVYPSIIDRYGNYWSSDANGNLIDDTGRTPVIVTQAGSTTYYDVLTPNGTSYPNEPGLRARYTVTTAPVSVSTTFNECCIYTVYQWVGTLYPVQSIQLPDGSQYSFSYDGSGELSSVTLPTGGTINYGYRNWNDSAANANRWLSTRTVGSDPPTTFSQLAVSPCTNYSTGCKERITVHKPSGDESAYDLTLQNGAWNTGVSVYSGPATAGTLLQQVTNTNTYSNGCVYSNQCSGANYLTNQLVTTEVFPNSNQTQASPYFTQTQTAYERGSGRPATVQVWDFSTSANASQAPAGTPLSEIDYAYSGADLQSVTHKSYGYQVAKTTYGYTATANQTTGLPQHGTQNLYGAFLQSIAQWIDSSGASLTQTLVYDDAGMLVSSTTPNGTTNYGYDSADATVTSTSLPVVNGISLSASASVDAASGVVTSNTDANGTKNAIVSFDALGRATEVDTTDANQNLVGKTVNLFYSPTNSGVHTYQNSTTYADIETELDVFGRLSRTAVANGQAANPWYQQDTCYDVNGTAYFQSSTYQGTGWGTAKVCSGAGTTTGYDGLGRTTSVSTADGTVQYTFSGRDLQRTDMNGVTTITQADALGRTGSICEVSSSNLIGSDPSAPCGLDIAGSGLLTQFNYGPDATSGNQQSVIQQGQPQTRVFRTDAIGRPTVAFEPESGETDYTYAYNATGLVVTRSRPRANQSSSAQKTHTTTQYDALSRVASITYDDGLTPAKYYTYDQPAGWAEAQNYLKGRLSRVYTNIAGNWAGTIFSYDPVGRPAQIYECLPSRCGDPSGDRSLSTTFDWTGNVTGAADPVSGWITYGRSQAGEVTSVNQQSYTDPVNVPNLVTNVVNGPNGPISYSLGNGLNVYRSYDASGRLSSNWLCRGQAAANCNTQIFGDGGYWSGGRIVASDDTVMNVHGTYAYDEFNRLSSTTLSSGGTSQQTFSYGYDRWGNRWQQNAPQGGPSPNLSFNPANNQIQGLGYDAAGNLLNDGLGSSFEYDAEGNLLAISGNAAQQFAYDALNHRVWAQRGSTTEEYAYDYAGRRTSIWQPYSNIGTEGRIYWDGRQIAFRAQDGSTYFDHQDWTGTERMRTNYAGAIANTYGSLPFGDGYSVSSPGSWSDQDTLKYAALEADGAGTAHAEFRQYSTVHGRWMSPDPYSGSYDSSNPQSYNRYSYVSNSPISYVDPSGLFMAPPVPPEAAAACPWCAPVVIGADIIFGLFEFLSSRHHVAAPVSSRPSTGIWDEKINGISVQPTSNLNSVLGLPIGGCEFGACGGGADGFFQGRTPGQGQDPFEIQFIRDAAGKLIQIRLFNWAGKAWKDIDLHGHASQDYPQNPHQHRWDWNKTPPRGPGIWLVPIRIPGPFPVTIDPCLLSPTVCHQFPSNGGPA